MTKPVLIEKTIATLEKLPPDRVIEVADFAGYLLEKCEEHILQEGIEKLASEGGSFDFLNDEPDLYTLDDLQERYR